MRLHANAALSLIQRKKMVMSVVAEHRPVSEVARTFSVSEPTARKWVRRFRAEGEAGIAGSFVGTENGGEQDRAAARRGDRGAAALAVHRSADRRAA